MVSTIKLIQKDHICRYANIQSMQFATEFYSLPWILKNCGWNASEVLFSSQTRHPQQPGNITGYLANTFQKICELSDFSPLFWLLLWIGWFICIRHVQFLKWDVFSTGGTCVCPLHAMPSSCKPSSEHSEKVLFS